MKHGWNAVLSDLANGDISKIDTILNYKIFEVFTELEIRKDKSIMMDRIMKEQEMKRK